MMVMYSLSTIHLAQRWNLVQQAFINNGATADTVFNYTLSMQPKWSVVLGSTSLAINTLCADCVLVSERTPMLKDKCINRKRVIAQI
jgi:hypothetical protein